MAGNIKGIIVEIGGDTSGLQKALSKVNSATSNLSKELKGVNSLLKLDPKNTELLNQKQTILNESIKNTQDKLKQLQSIKEEADKKMAEGTEINEENYRALQREIINTENKLSNLKNEASNWNKAGDALIKFGDKLDGIASKVDNLGNKLTKNLTVPITSALTLATKEAIEFESAFTGVTKTVDGTEEQLNDLKQGIKDLAKEIPSSTTEISAVAEAAGQLGIKTEDILSFTKVMIDLGNSTNLSSEEAASALAKFANITNMSAKDYDKLGSVIVDLGNNFATTEADIVSMATRLAATGELAGLSQPQILSLATAMSSVGIEAEAGGSAMSKLLKKIQVSVELGGKNLNAFAKVAGMSSKEFKKAFEKDAVSALSAFISGLNDTKRNGKSAIAILDDMGLNEVRLSNTILSLSNASEVMNEAVKVGNKAWEENTALINEANKRYGTTESQLKIAKNKIKDVAVSLGDKLLPTVNKLLDKADKWINKFDNLSDSEKENIINIGLMVAAAGPLLKIASTGLTTIGKVTTGIGTVTKAIGLAKNGIGDATGPSANLAKAFQSLVSPAGLATVGITALTAITLKIANDAKEATKESDKLKNKILEEKKSIDDLRISIDNKVQSELAEIDNSKDLWSELKKITDENGKIKDGYELRAKVITNQLSEALGTEISITDNVIDKYKELQNEIDNLILKKQAEAILSGYEEKNNEAIKQRTQKSQELLDIEKQIANAEKEVEETRKKTTSLSNSFKWAGWEKATANYEAAKKNLENLQIAYKETDNIINTYTSDIENYQYNLELYTNGTTESLQKMIDNTGKTYTKNGEIIKTTYSSQISEQQLYNKKAKILFEEAEKSNNETEKKKTKFTIDESNRRLETLAQELISQTSTTNEMSDDVKDAWKKLAEGSFDIYSENISKLSPEMKSKIEELTGVIADDTSVAGAASDLGDDIVASLDKQSDAEKAGENYIAGVKTGIENQKTQNGVLSSVKGFAQKLINAFNNKLDEHSPSKESEESAKNFVLGFSNGIAKNKNIALKSVSSLGNSLISSFNAGEIQNAQSKITSSDFSANKTVFTTPQMVFNVQKMDEANLNMAFNYVNRRLGSQY